MLAASSAVLLTALSSWRDQRDREGQQGLEPKTPGPKPAMDDKGREIARLKKQVAALEKENRIQKGLIDVHASSTSAPREVYAQLLSEGRPELSFRN